MGWTKWASTPSSKTINAQPPFYRHLAFKVENGLGNDTTESQEAERFEDTDIN